MLLLLVVIAVRLENLPLGNFGHLGPCVLKFVSMGDKLLFSDLTEYLVHANRPIDLIYTVSGRKRFSNRSIPEEENVLDFKFYEICTVTVFVGVCINDNQFRIDFFSSTRDAHRGRQHSNFILISHMPPKDVILLQKLYDTRLAVRIFALHVKSKFRISNPYQLEGIEWYFICPYCNNIFYRIDDTNRVKTLTVSNLQAQWRTDIGIGTDMWTELKPVCRKGQYYITLARANCPLIEMQYLSIANVLNVTFVKLPYSESNDYDWGFYYPSISSKNYAYSSLRELQSFRCEGYHISYCNFNVWSENTDLAVWVSPFGKNIWVCTVLIIPIVVFILILQEVLEFRKCIYYELIKSVGIIVFVICVNFVRQVSTSKNLSRWIVVSLFFTSFILLAQYELYLTGNLVVPPPFEKIRAIREFFDRGYTLVYANEDNGKYVSTRSQLLEEFREKSLGNFSDEKTITIRYILNLLNPFPPNYVTLT